MNRRKFAAAVGALLAAPLAWMGKGKPTGIVPQQPVTDAEVKAALDQFFGGREPMCRVRYVRGSNGGIEGLGVAIRNRRRPTRVICLPEQKDAAFRILESCSPKRRSTDV